MQTITKDTADFLPNDCLRILVYRAIDASCEREYHDDPLRGAAEAVLRKTMVNETLAIVEDFATSQNVMLKAYLKFYTGERQ